MASIDMSSAVKRYQMNLLHSPRLCQS